MVTLIGKDDEQSIVRSEMFDEAETWRNETF